MKLLKIQKGVLRKAPRNKCFHYINNFNTNIEKNEGNNSNSNTNTNSNSNTKPYKSFKELREELYKKKGIKYWSNPVEKGIKNDIDLL